MEELGFMRDKSTFNKPHNHAYSLETSKLMALMHATELPVVSKNLVPSDITVKGDKKMQNKFYTVVQNLLVRNHSL